MTQLIWHIKNQTWIKKYVKYAIDHLHGEKNGKKYGTR